MAKLFSPNLSLTQDCVFSNDGHSVLQTLKLGKRRFTSSLDRRPKSSKVPTISWVQSYLSGAPIRCSSTSDSFRVVDLFCGSGGLSTGLRDAARSLGAKIDVVLAADADLAALEIYRENHGPVLTSGTDLSALVNYQVGSRGKDAVWGTWPTLLDPHMASYLTELDVVVAGPPCQGHSNLNNKTRRTDAKNLLYLVPVAFAVATSARLCIIENVPDVLSDSHNVVETARALFHKSGYQTDDVVLSADDFGVPQRRRRHFLVAMRNSPFDFEIKELTEGLRLSPITLRQAISDLQNISADDVFNTIGNLSKENVKRIDWLFDHDAFDLPNKLRPDCHKDGHTYPSVYGRMKWDEVAQTVTTGFLSPGRGRYVHPSKRRTLTPHEAARIQSFPDSYRFSSGPRSFGRSLLAQVIGDAVPPLLGRTIGLVSLALLIESRDVES